LSVPAANDDRYRRGLEALRQGNTGQAIELLGAHGADFPQHWEGQAALGIAFGQQGDFDSALRYLDRATRALPEVPQIHYNRGVVLERAERMLEAAAAYEETLRLKPDFGQARQRLAAMEQQAFGTPLAGPPGPAPAAAVSAAPASVPSPAAGGPSAAPRAAAAAPGSATAAPRVFCTSCRMETRPGVDCEWCSAPLRAPRAQPSPSSNGIRPPESGGPLLRLGDPVGPLKVISCGGEHLFLRADDRTAFLTVAAGGVLLIAAIVLLALHHWIAGGLTFLAGAACMVMLRDLGVTYHFDARNQSVERRAIYGLTMLWWRVADVGAVRLAFGMPDSYGYATCDIRLLDHEGDELLTVGGTTADSDKSVYLMKAAAQISRMFKVKLFVDEFPQRVSGKLRQANQQLRLSMEHPGTGPGAE
jgi:tetratricopeptide (TPR) repeat protein